MVLLQGYGAAAQAIKVAWHGDDLPHVLNHFATNQSLQS